MTLREIFDAIRRRYPDPKEITYAIAGDPSAIRLYDREGWL